ncbi:MAG: heavy metal translocating P-type ATPase [Oscillospiraceae bacterium]|nr:heavy metal translocating P-type ATPase [Oscillospiraceae bacterium]
MQKTLFDITGMTCAACSSRIEKRVSKLEGVGQVSVSLLTNSMSCEYDECVTNPEQVVKSVIDAGYGATARAGAISTAAGSNAAGRGAAGSNVAKGGAAGAASAGAAAGSTSANVASPGGVAGDSAAVELRSRLVASAAFTIPLFYISMGDMLRFPLPAFLSGMENAAVFSLALLLLALPVVFINRDFFKVGLKNLVHLAPNMDSLIAIGSGAALVYGIYATFRIAWAAGRGDMETMHRFSMDLYFESSAMILTLITLGRFLEARAKGRTTSAIAKLMELAPKTATVIRNGSEEEIPAGEVIKGDIVIVKEGRGIPVDGVVVEGYAAVDESAITGESLPKDKKPGDRVAGGTVSKSGYIKFEATEVGEETTLAGIIRLVIEATSGKAPVARLADKVSGIFVPVVIAIAICAGGVWLLAGKSFEFALTTCIAVLVISCPCALGLATPTAIMVGMGRGAANGILIKSAEALEELHSVDAVVLDKTGTITRGIPVVTDVAPYGIYGEQLLYYAASLESKSAHPLALPIVAHAAEAGVAPDEVEDYESVPGRGVWCNLGGASICGGNRSFMAEHGVDASALFAEEENLSQQGKTAIYLAVDGKLAGLIALADDIKQTSPEAVSDIKAMGIETLMLTGDDERTAKAVGARVGIGSIIAQILPADKEREVRALQEQGRKVAFVGDGINDAPALTRADVGIAIGAGTDIAIESADVVLMNSELSGVADAIRLSKAVMRNVKQNLFWAFIYNTIGIPVAAGAFYALTGWLLSPMIAAAAMSMSSVSVVTNALRLARSHGQKSRH